MFILDYNYVKPTIDKGDYIAAKGVDRASHISECYLPNIPAISLTQRTAVLYSAGFTIHQAETRKLPADNYCFAGSIPAQDYSMIIKESSLHAMHKWIGSMLHNELVVHANINSNTCASSMYALWEAEQLLTSGKVDEVIIIAEERTSYNTLRIFNEHRIPLVCGDGFAIIRLTNKKSDLEVKDTKWEYSYQTNPFKTTKEGYALIDTPSDNINPHGTHTATNDIAEAPLLLNRNVIEYKPTIGHTQGVSGLLELCMTIDEPSITGSTLCVASGLGGFYGSCILHKH